MGATEWGWAVPVLYSISSTFDCIVYSMRMPLNHPQKMGLYQSEHDFDISLPNLLKHSTTQVYMYAHVFARQWLSGDVAVLYLYRRECHFKVCPVWVQVWGGREGQDHAWEHPQQLPSPSGHLVCLDRHGPQSGRGSHTSAVSPCGTSNKWSRWRSQNNKQCY